MKRIFIVRHAKSSWADLSLRDKDRPLNARGNRDGPVMAEKIKAITGKIDGLFSSSSQRTRETSAHLMKHLEFDQVSYLDKLYHASYQDMIEVIHEVPQDMDTAMIVGHNPGSTDLYNYFASSYLDNLPTCGVFLLEIDGNWQDADQQHTVVKHLMYPKMFL